MHELLSAAKDLGIPAIVVVMAGGLVYLWKYHEKQRTEEDKRRDEREKLMRETWVTISEGFQRSLDRTTDHLSESLKEMASEMREQRLADRRRRT